MRNVCRLERVCKSYPGAGGAQRVRVLDGLTLDLPTDGITVLLGRSGCGKTTLLRVLADLEMRDGGSVAFYDENGRENRPRIGLVFQEPRLMPWLDVRHNIMFHQSKPDWDMAERLIALMGLEGFGGAYPDALSGGMASRVAIARALAYQPRLLLMDEPFAALDYFAKRALEEEIVALNLHHRMGIIFVTHDVDEALLIGRQLVVMQEGAQPVLHRIGQDYPRQLESAELVGCRRDILRLLEEGARYEGK